MIKRKQIFNIKIIALRQFLLLGFVFFIFTSVESYGQCGMALKEVALQEIGESTYLKDFRVRLEEGKNPKKPPQQEFTILLNKGTHYRFTIKADKDCDDLAILKLYDFNHYYGANYDPDDGTSVDKFDFFCAKTQVYYLSISFAEAKEGCAAAIVSMVGNYNAN